MNSFNLNFTLGSLNTSATISFVCLHSEKVKFQTTNSKPNGKFKTNSTKGKLEVSGNAWTAQFN